MVEKKIKKKLWERDRCKEAKGEEKIVHCDIVK